MKTKKNKRTPEQLEEAIESLIYERYGEGAKFLLNAVESDTGYSNFLTNDSVFMFYNGAILFGRFCEDAVKYLYEQAKK